MHDLNQSSDFNFSLFDSLVYMHILRVSECSLFIMKYKTGRGSCFFKGQHQTWAVVPILDWAQSVR